MYRLVFRGQERYLRELRDNCFFDPWYGEYALKDLGTVIKDKRRLGALEEVQVEQFRILEARESFWRAAVSKEVRNLVVPDGLGQMDVVKRMDLGETVRELGVRVSVIRRDVSRTFQDEDLQSDRATFNPENKKL